MPKAQIMFRVSSGFQLRRAWKISNQGTGHVMIAMVLSSRDANRLLNAQAVSKIWRTSTTFEEESPWLQTHDNVKTSLLQSRNRNMR